MTYEQTDSRDTRTRRERGRILLARIFADPEVGLDDLLDEHPRYTVAELGYAAHEAAMLHARAEVLLAEAEAEAKGELSQGAREWELDERMFMTFTASYSVRNVAEAFGRSSSDVRSMAASIAHSRRTHPAAKWMALNARTPEELGG